MPATAEIHTRTQPQMPKPEWIAPLTRGEIDRAATDPKYKSFLHVARYIGAWSTPIETDYRDRFHVDMPTTVFVPLVDDLAGTVEGECKVLTDNGKELFVDFEATLCGIEQGFAAYSVKQLDPDREHEAY